MTPEREQAHALLGTLPDNKLTAVRSLPEVIVESVACSLALAPVEEELTSEISAQLERGKTSLARGEAIPHADILREFGLES